MINQKMWIGITVGVFIAGMGIGFAILHFSHVSHMTQISGMHDMSGMGGMGGMSGMGGMGGMSGMGGMGGGQSRHGQFYAPGSIHQLCHQDSSTSQAYCEPYYQVMSSVPGVRITHIHPLDNNSLEITIREISTATDGVKQNSVVFIGNDYLSGKVNVPSGWKGETKVTVDLTGMGIVYDYESMHAHLFASEDTPMDHSTHQ